MLSGKQHENQQKWYYMMFIFSLPVDESFYLILIGFDKEEAGYEEGSPSTAIAFWFRQARISLVV